MNRAFHLLALSGLTFVSLILFAWVAIQIDLLGIETTSAAPVNQPGNVTVLAGSGQDTETLLSFFPRDVRISVGDTITWKQNSDDAHTVSFLGPFPGRGDGSVFTPPGELAVPANNYPFPGRQNINYANPVRVHPFPGPDVYGSVYRPGEFISSGRMASVPQTPGLDPVYSFSLTFDTPGTFSYICLTHTDQMFGTVEVVSASSPGAPTPEEADAKGRAELAKLLEVMEAARAQRVAPARSEIGPGDTSIWYVAAGNSFFRLGDDRVVIDEFFPKNLTVTSGDTVVWASNGFHSVTFNPSPIIPPLNQLEPLPDDGTIALVNNAEVYIPTKPTAVFDPTRYYVSGNMSRGQPGGTAWTLTFERPGTFEYYCAVHRDRGMVATVIVLPKDVSASAEGFF